MKIAIIAPPWVPTPPRTYGGTESVLDTLARGLQNMGHEVVLFATGDSTCPVPRRYRFENALGTGRADSEIMESLHVMSAYENLRDFDIIHDHTLLGPIVSAWYPEIPVVTTNHAPFVGNGLEDFYRSVGARVPIIAISEHQARSVKDMNIVSVIHHGIDVGEFSFGNGDGNYMVFLGRMNPFKGVHTAIAVAREAGLELKIAAKCREPAEKSYFREVIKPLLGSGVEYVGEVDFNQKIALVKNAICLLNPINWPEPFGMVMIEALACGTPVVATNAGAAPEIVQDGVNGFICDSIEALCGAVQLVSKIDRLECRKSVEERFSQELMVKKHLETYEKVISNFRAVSSRDSNIVPLRAEMDLSQDLVSDPPMEGVKEVLPSASGM